MKSNIYVLDTSIISALFKEKDFFHSQAKDVVSQIPEDALVVVPITVLIELEVYTKNEKDWREIIDNGITDLADEIQEIDLTFLQVLRFLNQRVTTKLKAIDLTVLVTALSRDAHLITFDEKLISASKFLGINVITDMANIS